MTKNTTLIMIFGLYLFFNVDLAMADTIELKDNRVLKVDSYWEKDGRVFYQKHGVEVSFEKSQVKKIIDKSGPAPKIVYRDESAENKNDLIQSKKKENTGKSNEQIIERVLKDSKYRATDSKNNSSRIDNYGRPLYDSTGERTGYSDPVPNKRNKGYQYDDPCIRDFRRCR